MASIQVPYLRMHSAIPTIDVLGAITHVKGHSVLGHGAVAHVTHCMTCNGMLKASSASSRQLKERHTCSSSQPFRVGVLQIAVLLKPHLSEALSGSQLVTERFTSNILQSWPLQSKGNCIHQNHGLHTNMARIADLDQLLVKPSVDIGTSHGFNPAYFANVLAWSVVRTFCTMFGQRALR